MPGSLESVQWKCMCAQTIPWFILSSERVFWGNGVTTHVNSKGKIPCAGKILLRGGLNPQCCSKQDSGTNTLPPSYSGPKVIQSGNKLLSLRLLIISILCWTEISSQQSVQATISVLLLQEISKWCCLLWATMMCHKMSFVMYTNLFNRRHVL